ncbi:MAG: hypothetical protein ACRBDL_01790 [Alphaproteobacteria bacterium]
MGKEQADPLDGILERRYIPEMRSNLEHRITEKAKYETPNVLLKSDNRSSLSANILSSFLDGFLLPRPVLSMAVLLCFGFGVGTYTDVQRVDEGGDVSEYFSLSDDEIGYEDFL